MHEIARPGNLALLNITGYQAQALQCLYSSGAPVWLVHMECDRSVETASWCFWPVVFAPYSSRPIYCSRYQRIGTITNRPTPGFLANTTTPPHAVWAFVYHFT